MSKTPRERRQAKNESQILDAATDLITIKGYENVSLRDIAKRADYSPAALYKYFESKAAIMLSVLARENGRLIEQLETIPPASQSEEHMIELCLAYIRFNLDNPAYAVLLNNLPSGRTSTRQPIPMNSPYGIFLEAVKNWVLEEKLQLQPDYGLEEITYSVWAQIHGMATLQLQQLKSFEADFAAADRRTLKIYLSGLRNMM